MTFPFYKSNIRLKKKKLGFLTIRFSSNVPCLYIDRSCLPIVYAYPIYPNFVLVYPFTLINYSFSYSKKDRSIILWVEKKKDFLLCKYRLYSQLKYKILKVINILSHFPHLKKYRLLIIFHLVDNLNRYKRYLKAFISSKIVDFTLLIFMLLDPLNISISFAHRTLHDILLTISNTSMLKHLIPYKVSIKALIIILKNDLSAYLSLYKQLIALMLKEYNLYCNLGLVNKTFIVVPTTYHLNRFTFSVYKKKLVRYKLDQEWEIYIYDLLKLIHLLFEKRKDISYSEINLSFLSKKYSKPSTRTLSKNLRHPYASKKYPETISIILDYYSNPDMQFLNVIYSSKNDHDISFPIYEIKCWINKKFLKHNKTNHTITYDDTYYYE